MKPSDPPLNANTLARALDVPANRITAIFKGQRGITGGSTVRLTTFFNTTAELWMNLQITYEFGLAERAVSGRVRKHIEQSRESMVSAKCRKSLFPLHAWSALYRFPLPLTTRSKKIRKPPEGRRLPLKPLSGSVSER